MSRHPVLENLERLQAGGQILAGQMAQWVEPERRRSMGEQAVREVVEASQEVASLLLSGAWRTSEADRTARIDHLLASKNLSEYGFDPFGFSPTSVREVVTALEFLHRVWFRAEVHDIQRVPEGRRLLIANYYSYLPFDGAVIGASLLLDRDPPRMARSMVEKFATALPWFGTFVTPRASQPVA